MRIHVQKNEFLPSLFVTNTYNEFAHFWKAYDNKHTYINVKENVN